MADLHQIPGTILFDGEMARRGYALNKMCFALNDAANRRAFLHDEAAFMDRFGLTPEQRDAVERRLSGSRGIAETHVLERHRAARRHRHGDGWRKCTVCCRYGVIDRIGLGVHQSLSSRDAAI